MDFCEPYLIALLGADEIISIDASGYENATIIHDMNEPAEDLAEQFDLVIDGGSLEHIFNFPVAILNVMRNGAGRRSSAYLQPGEQPLRPWVLSV
jgi:hypothetical protein